MNRLLRRLRREDAGISMTETLVAVVLTTLMMAMVGTMFVQVTRITTASNDTQTSNGLAAQRRQRGVRRAAGGDHPRPQQRRDT